MLQDLVIPEEFLQLDKLKSAIEITSESSFFAILGVDTKELSKEIESYLLDQSSDIFKCIPKSEKILNEII